MYKIRNITRGKVNIGDLNLILNNNEEKDLDRFFPRPLIEASIDLRWAIGKKFVTEPEDDRVVPIAPIVTTLPEQKKIDDTAIKDLEKRILSHLSNELAGLKVKDNSAIENKLDALLKAFTSGNKPVTAETDDTEVTLDADKLIDIHSRTIERISRNAEAHVSGQEKVVKSDVEQRADELEGLV
jgi:low affinity Fe/Cu permease